MRNIHCRNPTLTSGKRIMSCASLNCKGFRMFRLRACPDHKWFTGRVFLLGTQMNSELCASQQNRHQSRKERLGHLCPAPTTVPQGKTGTYPCDSSVDHCHTWIKYQLKLSAGKSKHITFGLPAMNQISPQHVFLSTVIPSQYVRTALFWEQLTFLTNADEIRSQRNFEPWPKQRQSVSCPPCHRHFFGKRNMSPSSPALTSQLFANAHARILELTSIYIAAEITQLQYTSRKKH